MPQRKIFKSVRYTYVCSRSCASVGREKCQVFQNDNKPQHTSIMTYAYKCLTVCIL